MGDRHWWGKTRTGSDMSIIALVIAGVGGCGSTGRDCTAMGCLNGAAIAIPVNTEFSNIVGSTLEVCRNDACLSGTFGDAPEPAEVGFSSVSLAMPDSSARSATDPSVDATVWKTATGYRIDIYYNVSGPTDVADGDSYHVRLMSAAGDILADFEQAVTYEALYPNGPDCDAQPCRRVGITF